MYAIPCIVFGTGSICVALLVLAAVMLFGSCLLHACWHESAATSTFMAKASTTENTGTGASHILTLPLPTGDALAKSLAVLKQDTGHYSHIASKYTDQEALNKAKEMHAEGKGPSATYISVQPNGEQLGQLLALMDAGKVKLIVEKVLPLFGGAGEAMQMVDGGHVRGKLVLVVVDKE